MSIFSKIPMPKVSRSTQNLSYESLLTCNAGYLVPCYFEDALPGDKFKINTEFIIRTSPLLAPAFVRMDATVHFFKVPKRICARQWDKFRTGGDDPNDYTDITNTQVPVLRITPVGEYHLSRDDVNFVISSKCLGVGSLADYLGFPALSASDFVQNPQDYSKWDLKHSIEYPLIPFIAYQLIYDYNYRDENYMTKRFVGTPLYELLQNDFPSFERNIEQFGYAGYFDSEDSTLDTINKCLAALFSLRRRAYRKDYFTSALPNTQKGPDVKVPLEGSTVDINGAGTYSGTLYGNEHAISGSNVTIGSDSNHYLEYDINTSPGVKSQEINGLGYFNIPKAEADFEGVGFSINTLRELFNVQRMFERNARFGSRIQEWYRGNFDVRISDSRIDQPEYLGGGITPISISEILNTSGTIYDGTEEPLGSLAGRGAAGGVTNKVKGYCEEDCYIIGILSLLPRTAYAGGMPRMFLKRNRLDFFNPMFQNLGEQEVSMNELTYDGVKEDDLTFGYVPRYSEYMYHNSQMHGDFLTSLRFWHLGRQAKEYKTIIPAIADDNPYNTGATFDASMLSPNSATFIRYGGANVQNEYRIFNTTSDLVHHFVVDVYNKAKYRRRMKKYSIPV